MNVRDKEAFEEWYKTQDRAGVFGNDDTLYVDLAWQTGCRHKQKEIDHLSNCIEQIGKRLFPFSGYTEIGKILEEIKAINGIYKQNAKPESN